MSTYTQTHIWTHRYTYTCVTVIRSTTAELKNKDYGFDVNHRLLALFWLKLHIK